MGIEMQIQNFNDAKIRMVWDNEKEQYFFSVVDIIQVLTDSATPRRYWSDLKRKLQAEGSELYEKIVQLKLEASDGKMRLTDVAHIAKRGGNVAQVARERLEEELGTTVISDQ